MGSNSAIEMIRSMILLEWIYHVELVSNSIFSHDISFILISPAGRYTSLEARKIYSLARGFNVLRGQQDLIDIEKNESCLFQTIVR